MDSRQPAAQPRGSRAASQAAPRAAPQAEGPVGASAGARAPAPDLVAQRALPKLELHCHIDGAARPQTLLDLALAAGVPLPARTVEALLPHVRVPPHSRSLDAFLATFDNFYPVLATPGAMARLAHELVEDSAADGVIHLEARCCPMLQARPNATAEDVLREVLDGLQSGVRAVGSRTAHGGRLSTGLIVCCYRSLSYEQNAELVRLALRHAGRGVIGVDLAGPERLPGAALAPLFAHVADAGLPITVHAGEAAGPDSVREALDLLHARRLGHGVALAQDAALAQRVAAEGLALECCLTSNLQTGAVATPGEHPFAALRCQGLRVTLNTDDPAVCGTTLSAELALAQQTWGDDRAALLALQRTAADAAFVDAPRRAALHAALDAARDGAAVPATSAC